MVSLRSRLAGALAIVFCGLTLLAVAPVRGAEESTLDRWFARQAETDYWSSALTQTRQMKTLTRPLVTEGRVWFRAPNRFRWELGQPAQTVAIRTTNTLWVIYPRLKRAEQYPLDAAQTGPWKDALTLLEVGFPRSRADLEAQFRIVSQNETNGVHEVELVPRSAGARRMVARLTIGFAADELELRHTEIEFADGSTLRNAFEPGGSTEPFADDQLVPDVPDDFKVSRPPTPAG